MSSRRPIIIDPPMHKRRRAIRTRPFTGPVTLVRPVAAAAGRFVDMENKFIDYETDNDAFATTWATMEDGTAMCISSTLVGDNESNRDGRVYHINSIHIRGNVSYSSAESEVAPASDAVTRICLVWDKQTNGAQLTATDVMDGGQTRDWLAFRNLHFTKRFQILMDKTIRIPVANTVTNEGAINLFANGSSWTMPFSYNHVFKKPVKVICKATTAVVTSVVDNSFHVIGVGTTVNASLHYQSRVRFSG